MGNSRALQKANKELTKAKAPSKPRDIIYDPMGQWNHPGQNTRIPGSDITMQGVPYPVYAQPNVGQPQMMQPGQEYMFPGADYVDEYPQMKRGGYMKGLVPMPKPSKKGLASKAYSRSLEATNKLFTESYLFKKPKDRKRKVFDPNAKYYAEGGNYGMPLGTGVSQNFIGNRDNFKVGGIPELPLRDNQVNYNAYVNRFEPMSKMQDGGYIETELTDDEIQVYREGGYIVEETSDYKKGGALLTKKVTCKKCGWKWDAADGGDDVTTCHKCGGQGLVHAQEGGDISIPSLTKAQNGGAAIIGEEYVYKKRPESVYKVNDRGEWQIKNKSTHGKYITIEDPEGTRSKELDRKAIPLFEYKQEQVKKIKQLKNEIKNPKEFVDLADKRTIRATTGQKINPNVDLKSGKYNKTVVDKIVKKAKSAGVDPATMLAIALQETNFGKSDSNLGHMLNKSNSNPYSYIDFYKDKLDEAKRAKINDELLQIQYYNGLGTVTPKTEKNYHGFEMQKIYGVPIPAGGINMRKNPLYGKQIKDLRDNVILQNAYIKGLLNQKQKGGVVSELSKKEINDLVAQGYIVEDVD